MTGQDALVDLLRRSHDDPAYFFQHVLKASLRRWQLAVCAEIKIQLSRGDRHLRVLSRTCHGAGKTYLAAGIALWWISTRPNSRGMTTAPTWAGVENLLWPEIAKLYNRSLLRTLSFGRLLTTQLQVGDGWYMVGAASDRPENLEGHHSPVASIRICDEAKAIPQEVFDATAGMLDAPETCDLWISTPSIASGPFYNRDKNATPGLIRVVVTVDDLIAENIDGKAQWKAERLAEWGENSPEYQSRALANYVDDAEGALYPASWVESAMRQTWGVDGPLIAGFDVAGSKDGDESVVAVVAGPDSEGRRHVRSVTGWRERDTMLSKGRAIQIANGAKLRVDSIGIGKGVRDAIALDRPCDEYRASDKAHADDRFINRKAEDSWAVRELLEKGLLRLPADDVLRKQFLEMRYQITPAGKIKVIDPPNDSPDRVDGCLIALAGEKWFEHKGWLAFASSQAEANRRPKEAAAA